MNSQKKTLKRTIGTICSHSAAQIFHGAKKEGFKTLGLITEERLPFYSSLERGSPEEFLVVENWKEILTEKIQEKLLEKRTILIPHGSFVAYLGANNVLDMDVPLLGNKRSLKWEADRKKERKWLKKAGINVPKEVKAPEKIQEACLVKFPGAKGGEDYFLAHSPKEFREKIGERTEYTIQEYIQGNRYYPHYFYSRIKKRLEILGMDRRDEANVDESFRFPTEKKTFVVVGNTPLVARESLLPKFYKLGENLVEASRELFNGLSGPFCIETVVKDNLEVVAFEISGRIVAGTNLYPKGSPYSVYYFDKPVSTGRRIAMEVKEAIEKNRLNEVIS